MTGKTSGHDRQRRPADWDRLREVFGDVLPETTRDERDPENPRRDTDTWYRENRPPHHDR
ncbi:hypothetical protein LX15_005678 [Streptoalloteichus tenebrarius]|uniref:Uncharacterized protein n=1 Tax=Streptoalloteichus tenebrarius (strain ATCC 17920 / DSM 40477 / JCM 4838 / CBS 697.72 / NBRC 16177 / NCIMB 11028 / NRRL B-12390 / A12253. 1 / ISP 5477) TaxID=1933 RepID=A0ABT1I2D9_STRSD|nr:hypothetical protein [Streptoalloteichus tenebrarius]MCP2261951.1 hypothetical protein [Streptoalloteichus tenebrarius]